MAKVLLWLVWIVELLLFVFGAGCVVLIFSAGDMGYGSVNVLAVILLIATVALCGYGVFKAARTLGGSGDPARLAIYMLMPVLAAFLFSGSCVILLNN